MESGILKDTSNIGVRACSGCGVVDLALGPAHLRLTSEAFLSLVGELQSVAGRMLEQVGEADSCSEVVPMMPLSVVKGLA